MIELLSRVEKYINFEENLKFVIGIEAPVTEQELDQAIKRKDEEDKYDRYDKRARFE